MKVGSDGSLTVGMYESAIPGIENAVLTADSTLWLTSYEQASMLAARLGGERFQTDIFAEADYVASRIEAHRAAVSPAFSRTETANDSEKPSVMKRIRDAQREPRPSSKHKSPNKGKNDVEL